MMFLKYFLFIIIFLTTTINACEKPTMPTEDEWNNWLQEVRKEALDIGISNKSVNLYLSDVKPQKKLYYEIDVNQSLQLLLKSICIIELINQE